MILFLCKDRNQDYPDAKYGLWNSASFVVSYLNQIGHNAKLISVVDGNSIDRIVTKFKPSLVILEALWVTPEKLKQLAKIHKSVEWVCRIHSKATFLANEGIAFEWINEYEKIPNVTISTNSEDFNYDLKSLGYTSVYLPNLYQYKKVPTLVQNRSYIHIGCFGSLRPMKNHVNQAIAAIKFGNWLGIPIVFHINGNRFEQKGENVLKNLRALFAYNKIHMLREHDWMPHHKFLSLVAGMDYGLQCSLSESFNIVTADFVSQNVPIVTSSDIYITKFLKAVPTEAESIYSALKWAYYGKFVGYHYLNKFIFNDYLKGAEDVWRKCMYPYGNFFSGN